MKIAPIYVDSGTIAIMKLIPNDRYIDEKKFYDVITSGYAHIHRLDEGIYKRSIKNTWNGDINGKFKINSGLYYIGDPCYAIGDLRVDFIGEFLCDENSKTIQEMKDNRIKFETYIIDEMGGDGDYVLSLTKTKGTKKKN